MYVIIAAVSICVVIPELLHALEVPIIVLCTVAAVLHAILLAAA